MSELHLFVWLNNTSCISHIVYSSISGHLDCFYLSAIMNNVSVNIGVQICFEFLFLKLGVKIWGYMVVL